MSHHFLSTIPRVDDVSDAPDSSGRPGRPVSTAAVIVESAPNLDMNTVDDFRHAYRAAFDALTERGVTAGDVVVLDLTHTDFVSVDAARALAEAHDLAAHRGIEFALVAVTRGIERALTVTGGDRLLPCHRTVDAAIAYTGAQ
ncbi:STAS domain-containing protein [Prescottella sp. R16]|uniref:STAS domain-containing protein n=1 Tax=Prescottella sp. R16 TaxID=3064529 RepID=UPI00272DDC82|nr:STAS domain-containing protein [Prescottella sp. R16]